MQTDSTEKAFEDFCPRCEHYSSEYGVCDEIKENVRDYPAKFSKKCNGEYYVERKDAESPGEQKQDETGQPVPAPVDAGEKAPDWAERIEKRIEALEKKIPQSNIIHQSFLVRAFAVLGHYIVASLILSAVMLVFWVLFMLLAS